MLNHEGSIEAVIVCLLVASIVGVVVYAIGHYGFKQAWAGIAGFVSFLIVLALCLL